MDNRNSMASMASWENLQIMVKIARQVLLEERPEVLNDEETRWELEEALERYGHASWRKASHSRAVLSMRASVVASISS